MELWAHLNQLSGFVWGSYGIAFGIMVILAAKSFRQFALTSQKLQQMDDETPRQD